MTLFSRARFHKSAADRHDLPNDSHGEVAFAGRSNSGKSSALNAIAGQSRLAHASKTPGRTRLINYFSTGNGRYLVDLPGYGYAKVARHTREPWARVLGEYLHERPELAGLILVADIRRALTDLDRALLDWYLPTGKPLHVLLSKADKLTRAQVNSTRRSVSAELAGYSSIWTAQAFSSLKRTGIDEARAIILAWLASEADPQQGEPESDQLGTKKTRAKGE